MPTFINPTLNQKASALALLEHSPRPMDNLAIVVSRFGSSTTNGRNEVSGVGTVAGVGTVDAMAVLINESNGLPMDMQRCAADGSYSFTRLPAGYYCVVIVDTTGEYRAKTAHVEVFDPLEFTMNSVVLSDALSGYPGEVKSVVVTATGSWAG